MNSPRAAENSHQKNNSRLALSLGLAYIALSPYEGIVYFGRSLPFWAGLAFLVASLLSPRRQSYGWPAIPATILGIWSILSLGWVENSATGLQAVLTLVNLLIISHELAVRLEGRILRICQILAINTVPLAIVVLATPADLDQRRTALGNANDVATFFVVACLANIFLIVKRGNLVGKLFHSAILLTIVAALLATGSRAGALTALIYAAATVAWSRAHGAKRIATLAGGTFATIIILQALPERYIPVRLHTLTDEFVNGNWSDRRIIWQDLWSSHTDILGAGIGQEAIAVEKITGISLVAHNTLIQAYLELGIIGALLLSQIVLRSVKHALQSPDRVPALPILLAVLAEASVLSLMERRVFWLAVGIAFTARRRDTPVRLDRHKAHLDLTEPPQRRTLHYAHQ